MGTKYTQTDYDNALQVTGVRAIEPYLGSGTPINHECSNGHVFRRRPTDVIHGGNSRGLSGCPTCNNAAAFARLNQKHSEAYAKRVLSRPGNTLVVLDPYITNHDKIKHQCTVCLNVWELRPDSVLAGSGCRLCSVGRTYSGRRTQDEYIEDLDLVHCKRIVPLGVYENQNTPFPHRCECGHVWNAHPSNLLGGHGCPKCAFSRAANTTKNKTYKWGNKTFSGIQGYEPQALAWIRANKTLKASEICAGDATKIPVIPFMFNGTDRFHYPDMYVPSLRLIIEVKSTYTMFERNNGVHSIKAKARAAIKLGYRYVVMVMTEKGERLKLPKYWLRLSEKQLRSWLRIR